LAFLASDADVFIRPVKTVQFNIFLSLKCPPRIHLFDQL